MSIKITHNYGFFSCCSVRLNGIIDYINSTKQIPINVDCSESYDWYKINNTEDITFEYFEKPEHLNIDINTCIDYHENYQYNNYKHLDYNNLNQIIKKYFSPSNEVNNIITNIEQKYNLNYDNICVLFYRGNDKMGETPLCKYNDYIDYANKIISINPNIMFLIQSDETEFIELMTLTFPNSIYFKDEIRHMNRCNETVDHVFRDNIDIFSKNYLGITIIMSKCKYIICGSGNCSIWIMLYRGHSENIYQNFKHKWFTD